VKRIRIFTLSIAVFPILSTFGAWAQDIIKLPRQKPKGACPHAGVQGTEIKPRIQCDELAPRPENHSIPVGRLSEKVKKRRGFHGIRSVDIVVFFVDGLAMDWDGPAIRQG
jgi:hypothetical protein